MEWSWATPATQGMLKAMACRTQAPAQGAPDNLVILHMRLSSLGAPALETAVCVQTPAALLPGTSPWATDFTSGPWLLHLENRNNNSIIVVIVNEKVNNPKMLGWRWRCI